MKKILAIGLSLFISQQVTSQVPKSFIGKTFYNVEKYDQNPRFGGMPSLNIKTATTGAFKRGDVMELVSISKLNSKTNQGFVVTGNMSKRKDTFFVNGQELSDRIGQTWTANVSKISDSKLLNAYPQAREGFRRNIINLPALKNEDQYIIELYVGAVKEVDCNHHSMLGEILTANVDGYGYSYFDVRTEERMMSTLMMCPDKEKKTKKFIYIRPAQTNYNSKVPLVIYAPESLQVRYKVYKASEVWNYAVPQ